MAIAHADMFNDAVSTDVNFWRLKECNSRGEKTMTVAEHRGIQHRIQNTKSAVEEVVENPSRVAGFVGLARTSMSQSGSPSSLISREFFTPTEGRGILLRLTGTWGKLRTMRDNFA